MPVIEEQIVLYLYEFTLLSNRRMPVVEEQIVLYLYEFTLLSNTHSGHLNVI